MIKTDEIFLVPIFTLPYLVLDKDNKYIADDFLCAILEVYRIRFMDKKNYKFPICELYVDNLNSKIHIDVIGISYTDYGYVKVLFYTRITLNLTEKIKNNFENFKNNVFKDLKENIDILLKKNFVTYYIQKLFEALGSNSLELLSEVFKKEVFLKTDIYNQTYREYTLAFYQKYFKNKTLLFEVNKENFENWYNERKENLEELKGYFYNSHFLLYPLKFLDINQDNITGKIFNNQNSIYGLYLNFGLKNNTFEGYVFMDERFIKKEEIKNILGY
ncbi:MAG: hypothetical protein NC925_04805 [Candidatus Omnitrophica bacterium]|nr:hypothetical protein [Candidatus Omnitrophota bacterium]